MNLLLDTHAMLWFFDGNEKLSPKAKTQIENPANKNFVSVASFWEIAIKISIDKLKIDLSMENLQRLAWENDMEILPIRVEHTFLLRSLPYFHKDPFDRLILVQSFLEGMDIVSGDEIFDHYLDDKPLVRIW